MLKKLLIMFLAAVFACSYAQGMKRRPGPPMDGRRSAKHPLFVVLESEAFPPQERARLKALAAKDMKAFSIEMRKHFMAKRKAEATRILALRKQILEAETPEKKKSLTAELRSLLQKRAEDRLSFHKKVLDESEKALLSMQNRCNQLKKEYNIRQKNKNAQVDRELDEILSANPPKHLERSANWDPDKPMLPKPSKKYRR